MFFTWCKCSRFYERVVYLPECTHTHICVIVKAQHKWSNLTWYFREMRNTWNWKESLSTSAPECLYHTMPSLMSCWVKEVVGEAALPSGKSCQESAGPSAGMGTSSTTSPGKCKEQLGRIFSKRCLGTSWGAAKANAHPVRAFSMQCSGTEIPAELPKATGIETSRWHWEILLINSIKRVDNSADW